RNGIDEIQSSRLFTNFTTNWAQGIEPKVDERELKSAGEAVQRDAEEDSEDKAQAKMMSPITAQRPIPTTTLPPMGSRPLSTADAKTGDSLPREQTPSRTTPSRMETSLSASAPMGGTASFSAS